MKDSLLLTQQEQEPKEQISAPFSQAPVPTGWHKEGPIYILNME